MSRIARFPKPIAGGEEWRVTRRIGRSLAGAEDARSFTQLQSRIAASLEHRLHPMCVMPLAQLRPGILADLPESEGLDQLVDGYVAQLTCDGILARTPVLSRSHHVYQGFLLARYAVILERAVTRVAAALRAERQLDIDLIDDFIPLEMGLRQRSGEVLFAILLARGLASADTPPGKCFTRVRMPFA